MTLVNTFVWACALLALTITGTPAANAFCFEEAASKYGLSAELLRAIARAESDLNPKVVNRTHLARTKTVDIGLMQINSSWLTRLSTYGVREQHLFDPCANVHVGAWILSDYFQRHGNTWEAVGAYNTACTQLKGDACRASRARYAWRVHNRLYLASTGRAPKKYYP
jgi:soluble lytic murein transglycosylase-like protein